MNRRYFFGALSFLGIPPVVALASPPRGWQPIETCPKDGSSFLVKHVDEGAPVLYESRIYHVSYRHIDWAWKPTAAYRSHAAHFPGMPQYHIGPTHWHVAP